METTKTTTTKTTERTPYGDHEVTIRKTLTVRPGPGRYADRLYLDVRVTRNGIQTFSSNSPLDADYNAAYRAELGR